MTLVRNINPYYFNHGISTVSFIQMYAEVFSNIYAYSSSALVRAISTKKGISINVDNTLVVIFI